MEWIAPTNPSKYDCTSAFRELPYVDWKKRVNFEVGDIVYIYVSGAVKSVRFMTEVINEDVEGETTRDILKYWKDDQQYQSGKSLGKYVRLKLLKEFTEGEITFADLKNHGLQGNIQSPRKLYDAEGNLLPWGAFIKKFTEEN